MKLTHKISALTGNGIATLILLLGLLTGCSRNDKNLVENIPASATTVSIVDFDILLKNAGCEINNGFITLTPDLKKIESLLAPRHAEMFDAIIKAAPAIDLTEVGFFSTGSAEAAVIRLKQPEIFEQGIRAEAESSDSFDGKTFYLFNDIAVAIEDNYAWISEDNVKLSNLLNELDKESFYKKYRVLSSNLTDSSDAVRIVSLIEKNVTAAPVNGVEQKFDRLFLVGQLTVTDNIMSLECRFTDKDNRSLDFSPYFEETGSDFLRFVDPQANIIAAIGKPMRPEIIEMVYGYLNRESGIYSEFIPMLKAIDGTTGFSARITSDINKGNLLNSGEYVLTTQLKESENSGVIQLLEMSGAKKMAETPVGGEIAQYEIPVNSGNLYAGLFQGTLAIGNRPVDDTFSNPFTTDFQGVRAGLIITFAPGSPLQKAAKIPYGVYCSAMIYSQSENIRLRFNGSSRNVVATIVELIATFMTDHSGNGIGQNVPDIVSNE